MKTPNKLNKENYVTWKEILKRQMNLWRELINRMKQGKSSLKFGLPFLSVSDIAEQFYSEIRLELNHLFGKIKTPEQEIGAILHEKLIGDAIPISQEEMFREMLEAEEIKIAESFFLMKFEDVFIIGKPDLIIFKRGIPLLLFEYKFSKYTMKTFQNQRVQAQIYCHILNEMGFNTNLLFYGIIIAARSQSLKNKELKAIPRKILDTTNFNFLLKEEKLELQFGTIHVFLYKYHPETAREHLEWALEYWKEKRTISLSDLMKGCEMRENGHACKIILSLVKKLVEEYSDNIISIHGIGSFFDKYLPEDWIKTDIDMICVVKNLEAIPKTHDWTDVRKKDYNIGDLTINLFFNSLEGLKDEEKFKKESWANYKWALLDLTVPYNNVKFYGQNIAKELPNMNAIFHDHEDLLRHALYHLNESLKEKNEQASKKRFTKAIFKFAFLTCVFHDDTFQFTSISWISNQIKKLVREGKIDTDFLDIMLEAMNFRRGIPSKEEFPLLRERFIKYCFHFLVSGKAWKKYDWEEIIKFCKNTYKGLQALENHAKRERNLFYLKK
ncbi:MAG: hypothetical protein ACTSU4_06665 [Promethearchaeota archaeon]